MVKGGAGKVERTSVEPKRPAASQTSHKPGPRGKRCGNLQQPVFFDRGQDLLTIPFMQILAVY